MNNCIQHKNYNKRRKNHKLIGKDGIKTEKLIVAGEMSLLYDKELYESNQTIKRSMKSILVMIIFILVN